MMRWRGVGCDEVARCRMGWGGEGFISSYGFYEEYHTLLKHEVKTIVADAVNFTIVGERVSGHLCILGVFNAPQQTLVPPGPGH